LKLIIDFTISHSNFTPDLEVIKNLLLSANLYSSKRIKLFNSKHKKLDIEIIIQFIETLPEPYSDLNKSKRPTIPDSEDNRAFLDILKFRKIISSFSETKKGLKVYPTRKG